MWLPEVMDNNWAKQQANNKRGENEKLENETFMGGFGKL